MKRRLATLAATTIAFTALAAPAPAHAQSDDPIAVIANTLSSPSTFYTIGTTLIGSIELVVFPILWPIARLDTLLSS